MIEFEWDQAKSRSNKRKHGVSFEEAQSVFYDDFAIQIDDEPEDGEERFLLLGMSSLQRILLICHCERSEGEIIRIISARKATASEKSNYNGPTL